MSASLVGSEMCIRDSPVPLQHVQALAIPAQCPADAHLRRGGPWARLERSIGASDTSEPSASEDDNAAEVVAAKPRAE
eukprot:11308184-Alexandrium_andersonii.AAC.1